MLTPLVKSVDIRLHPHPTLHPPPKLFGLPMEQPYQVSLQAGSGPGLTSRPLRLQFILQPFNISRINRLPPLSPPLQLLNLPSKFPNPRIHYGGLTMRALIHPRGRPPWTGTQQSRL